MHQQQSSLTWPLCSPKLDGLWIFDLQVNLTPTRPLPMNLPLTPLMPPQIRVRVRFSPSFATSNATSAFPISSKRVFCRFSHRSRWTFNSRFKIQDSRFKIQEVFCRFFHKVTLKTFIMIVNVQLGMGAKFQDSIFKVQDSRFNPCCERTSSLCAAI